MKKRGFVLRVRTVSFFSKHGKTPASVYVSWNRGSAQFVLGRAKYPLVFLVRCESREKSTAIQKRLRAHGESWLFKKGAKFSREDKTVEFRTIYELPPVAIEQVIRIIESISGAHVIDWFTP